MATLPLSADDHELIERLAELLIPMGMTPIEARVQGLLIVSSSPLTLDEIVAALGVSKSSVSVATRELERHGAATRFTERGTKRVRYGLMEGAGGFLSAQLAFLGSIGELLRDRATTSANAATSRRFQAMGHFYLRIHDALKTALAED